MHFDVLQKISEYHLKSKECANEFSGFLKAAWIDACLKTASISPAGTSGDAGKNE